MRHRYLVLALLAGIALTTLGPVRPASAGEVDCVEFFVIDPTLCQDLPPPDAPPPQSPPSMRQGPMDNQPGNLPGMTPNQPGEVCVNQTDFSDPAFIVETGQPDKLIYRFNVRVRYCTLNGIVTQASVLPGIDREPFDPRIQSISLPFVYDGPSGTGGPFFVQAQDVQTVFCPDLVNCVTYRHTIQVTIDARLRQPLAIEPDLFLCSTC
jgi:hypothetical protein